MNRVAQLIWPGFLCRRTDCELKKKKKATKKKKNKQSGGISTRKFLCTFLIYGRADIEFLAQGIPKNLLAYEKKSNNVTGSIVAFISGTPKMDWLDSKDLVQCMRTEKNELANRRNNTNRS